jgi:antitoxin component YwqK of YwqJK toxin-antitoxin module
MHMGHCRFVVNFERKTPTRHMLALAVISHGMKTKLALFLSVIVNVFVFIWLIINNHSSSPPFEPFHIFSDFKYEDLVSEGYSQVPVDVIMLGKTDGDVTINYQFDESSKRSFWRSATIELPTNEIDTLQVYSTIEKYNADIIFQENLSGADRLSIPLSSPFFVRHRYNHQIFECYLGKSDSGYAITSYYEPPVVDKAAIEAINVYGLQNRKRFGADTTVYEDGTIHIQNFWNWTMEGKDIWISPGGKVQMIRIYKNGELQVTEEYYENGQIASRVLSYNQTGTSTWWYPSGRIKEEVNYIDGRRNGWHVKYYENGAIESKGKYNGGYYDTGIKEGEWIFYDSLRRTVAREFYERDTLIKKIK